MTNHLAPGVRVEIRDAEWRVKRLDMTSDGGQLLTCEGLSELVRGREATFLSKLETSIRVLQPEATELCDDLSSGYRASRLYLDTLLRRTPPTDDRIHIGHQAAMDLLPYQLDPASQALAQPRQRILIADSVGLGKTLEAGILVSELIARGRGKRILVLAVKSMLSQFQQEFWNRFTIPLVRLDSQGLQRVRNRIPANHNPFHYFDRSIISIDTLKQDIEYRHYLEQAYWDIIIIDEAHNVAERGSSSQRARLARLLATRSDTLIMLSATPHDGKAESFASLMNMLDPTAIANPSDYSAEDFRDKGLVIRRFKQDVRDQLTQNFPERDIATEYVPATLVEDHVSDLLMQASFHTLDGKGSGQLFRTTLEKALFSSPAACASIIRNRLRRLEKQQDKDGVLDDIDCLNDLLSAVEAITPQQFSKYRYLCDMLSSSSADSLGWNPRNADDRLVIFTESIKTLEFLHQHLSADLKLKKGQVAVLRGDMRDSELAATVEAFNQLNSPLRLLICSDVASEGINLHHLSHRMIHFDIPWSLMVFQQRNGRIDRYGQQRQPQIRYLLSESGNQRVRGDARVLEVLIEKDAQAGKNIGDPSEFMAVFSQEDEELLTASFIERDDSDDISSLFSAFLDDNAENSEDSLSAFLPAAPASDSSQRIARDPRLFASDLEYASEALRWLGESGLDLQMDLSADTLRLTAPQDLRQRLRYLPPEVRPEHDRFALTSDRARIRDELKRCRDEDSPWPGLQYLWPLHPVLEWLADRALNAFGRHTAPVLRLRNQLAADEHWVLIHGGFPNRRGHVHIQAWCAVHLQGGQIIGSGDLDTLRQHLRLDDLSNPGVAGDTSALQKLLPTAVQHARQQLQDLRRQHEEASNQRFNQQLQALETLKSRHLGQLELDLGNLLEGVRERRREERRTQIERVFDDYLGWLENTQLTEDQPYLQVAAVFTGAPVSA